MDEEEIHRPSRSGGRGGYGRSGGAGLGLKAALVTGLATLAILALALFAGGTSEASDPDAAFHEAGYAAVQALGNTDPGWWTGGEDLLRTARSIVKDLFGEQGATWWEDRAREVEDPDYDNMTQEEKTAAIEARERFLSAKERWSRGAGAEEGERWLRRIVGRRVDPNSRYKIVGAWLTEVALNGAEEILASFPAAANIQYEAVTATRRHVPGTVQGSTATVFWLEMRSATQSRKGLRAYVALWRPKAKGASTSGGLALLLLFLGPLLVAGAAWAVANAHTRGVRDLARDIDRLGSAGDASRSLRAQGGEASHLARAVERMVGNLEFRSRHGDADLDEIVDRERRIAQEIHGGLMNKNPPRLSDYEVETLFKPGYEIGGDHFEYFPIDDDHLGVILLDTNVRGIRAALVMSATKAYVRAAAPGVLSPADVLRRVNRDLAGDLPPGRHVTALYVVISTKEGKAVLASAGHLPLLVYRHATGKLAKVNPEGIALGLDVGPVFDRALQEGDIPINVGDRIVLYTDGALMIVNEEGEEFGESRFYATVSREAPKNSQAFVNFVGSAIDQFHLSTPQNDDITISTVKRLK